MAFPDLLSVAKIRHLDLSPVVGLARDRFLEEQSKRILAHDPDDERVAP